MLNGVLRIKPQRRVEHIAIRIDRDHDLVGQVPGKDQQVVRPGPVDRLGCQDRNVRPWEVHPLLVGAAVDGEVQQVGPDAAVVEQGVAFARCAVACDPLARLASLDQKAQKFAAK